MEKFGESYFDQFPDPDDPSTPEHFREPMRKILSAQSQEEASARVADFLQNKDQLEREARRKKAEEETRKGLQELFENQDKNKNALAEAIAELEKMRPSRRGDRPDA